MDRIRVLVVCLVAVGAEKLEAVSFAAPYKNLQQNFVLSEGLEKMQDVEGHNIKLTAGSPGDAGAVWGKTPVNLMEFSAVLEVSVDGPGTKDPDTSSTFAMFIANEPTWKAGNGEIAGTTEAFTGLAIQIHLSAQDMFAEDHKEVRVFLNPAGNMKYANMVQLGQSCKVGFALEKVKLKLMMIQDMLFIVTDEHGDGHWNDCVSIPIGLGDMMKNAYVGFSSVTGPKALKPAQIYSLRTLTIYNKWDEAEVGHGQVGHEDYSVDPMDELKNADETRIEYTYHEGHLDGSAPDLQVAIVTMEEAREWCTAHPQCMSFSQNGADAMSTTAVTTYFKETVTW
jgi:hypothetical protein